MVYIRSFIFNSVFYIGTAILVVVMGPVLLLPPFLARYIARFWGWLAHKQLVYCWYSPAGIWQQASGQAGDLCGETSIGLGNNYLELVASCPGICIKSRIVALADHWPVFH